MQPDDLLAAIRAALDETERIARAAQRGDGRWEYRDMRERDPDVYPWQVYAPDARLAVGTGLAPQEARHIAHHDPAAVLRRVAADREILAEHSPHRNGACPVCWRETTRSCLRQDYPCLTLTALARGMGIDPQEM